MLYKLLADGVVIIHFLWILFLLFGGFWGRRYRGVRFVHIPALVFAFLLELFNWYCPLTYLEVWLRRKHDPALGYAGSFIAHYLERLIYIEVDRWVIVLLTGLLCGVNGWLYLGTTPRPPPESGGGARQGGGGRPESGGGARQGGGGNKH